MGGYKDHGEYWLLRRDGRCGEFTPTPGVMSRNPFLEDELGSACSTADAGFIFLLYIYDYELGTDSFLRGESSLQLNSSSTFCCNLIRR